MAKASNEKEEKKDVKAAKVKKPFRDKDNFDKLYSEGEDVRHFDNERLENLKKLGHVE